MSRFDWDTSYLPSAELLTRLEQFYALWHNTRFRQGYRSRGRAVGCEMILIEWLDFAFGRTEPTPWPHTQVFPASQDESHAAELLRLVRSHFPGELVREGLIRPGDLVACRVGGVGPSHGMLAWSTPWTWLDADRGRGLDTVRVGPLQQFDPVFRFRPDYPDA